MRLTELTLTEEQALQEINLKQALAGGLLGAAALSLPSIPDSGEHAAHLKPIFQKYTEKWKEHQQERELQKAREQRLVQAVMSKYNIDKQLADDIVALAHKYEHPKFPTAKDILAVVGIESSFRPEAVSGLQKDPARGLMQVRAGVWGLDPSELESIEQQIAHGAMILSQYYAKLKSKQAALHAYNVGLTAFRRGEDNPNYVDKFKKELRLYKDI